MSGMSDEPVGTYGFLPWLRAGMSTEIARVDGSTETAPRAAVPVTVTLRVGVDLRDATADLALYGPGEVAGIDLRLVVRTDPAASVQDAQSNYFPFVELDPPDFPWRHTPARATAADRLRPWLVLVVLTADEIEESQPTGADGGLPWVKVKTAASLPDLAQSWAWAHVQVSGLAADGSEPVAGVLTGAPDRAVSRLLCPRRLVPRMAYDAYLVPAFERGRRAGLGETMDETLDGLTLAWQAGDTGIRLPVYYRWSFQTGTVGDFEQLVTRLQARAIPATVGQRDMDVGGPGAGLPPAAGVPLALEGALMSPATVPSDWDPAERDPFVTALQELVNRPAMLLEEGDPTRVVAPPLYGRWHAARDRLQPGGQPPWFQELNADPRLRTTAGLGTLVVQDQQEQLMASAWDQLQGVQEANQRLRQAQLAREVAAQVRTRHLAAHDEETALLVSAPLHRRVRASPRTVRALVQTSPVAGGVLEGQFRRVARPRGPIGRRQDRPARAPATTLLGRMNRGELSPAPPPPTPSGMATPSRTGTGIVPPWLTPERLRLLRALPGWLTLLAVVLFLITLGLLVAGLVAAGVAVALVAVLSLAVAAAVRRLVRRFAPLLGLRDGTLTPEDVRDAPVPPGFEPGEAPPDSHVPSPGPAPGAAVDAAAVARFRAALGRLVGEVSAAPAASTPLEPVDLPRLRDAVLAGVDPRATVAAALRKRLSLPPWVEWEPEDPLEPVMAAPVFEAPMYEPLRALSQEWLLPGVGEIPADTVSLLVTNQRFVEGYMVGLNHEMARELLWREYPTDQRGTCFRQFWDVRGYVPPPGTSLDPEALRDIKPIHAWGSRAQLGVNSSRRPPPGGAHLVLLVRGEVLRRYPRTVVYAASAALQAGARVLGDEQRHPVFEGALEPDVCFYGFELTPAQVRGSTDPAADQGWFFVLQEQPTEPRFGLDLPERYGRQITSWNDVSWGDLVADEAELDRLGYIDLDADRPDTRLVVTPPGEPAVAWHADRGLGATGARASDIAYITLQRPFRVAVHASDMLPPQDG